MRSKGTDKIHFEQLFGISKKTRLDWVWFQTEIVYKINTCSTSERQPKSKEASKQYGLNRQEHWPKCHHAHIYIHICIYIYIYTYIDICIYLYIYICPLLFWYYLSTHNVHIYTCICTVKEIYIYIYIYICIYMHIHAYM